MKIYLETKRPVALESFDYLYPLGATQDNSRNPEFNIKLKRYPGDVLDLGCAGGGFVKDCVDEGRLAIGLEGNDFGFKNTWAEWATIPNNLFTCDITGPFVLHTGEGVPHGFQVITAWEVLEHIEKQDLTVMFTNVRKHLANDSLFVVSISNKESFTKDKTVDLHRIHEDQVWWEAILRTNSFRRDRQIEDYFGDDWVRTERKSFHMVLRKI